MAHGARGMRDDRIPHESPVRVAAPEGDIWEMSVWLTQRELKATPGYALEPWVRVTCGVDWLLSAGVSVTGIDDDR